MIKTFEEVEITSFLNHGASSLVLISNVTNNMANVFVKFKELADIFYLVYKKFNSVNRSYCSSLLLQ